MSIEALAVTNILQEVNVVKAMEAAQQLANKVAMESFEPTALSKQDIYEANLFDHHRNTDNYLQEINNKEILKFEQNEAGYELKNKIEENTLSETGIEDSFNKILDTSNPEHSKLLNSELPSNSPIEIYNPRGDNNITVHTDELGRTQIYEVDKIKIADGERDLNQQRLCRTLKDGLETDDAGHLIANEFGGPSEQINYQPMDSVTNRSGEWRNMEKSWKKTLEDGGQITDIRMKIDYDGTCKRPTDFNVSYKENGATLYRFVDNSPLKLKS